MAVYGATWEARSKLELNVGPTKTQKLRRVSKTANEITTNKIADEVTLKYKDGSTDTITPAANATDDFADTTIDLATSISCISIGDTFEIPEESQESFKVKQFKKGIFGMYDEEDTLQADLSASLNNFNNYWTKFSLKDLKTTDNAVKLNFVIPKHNYGLLFI